MSNNTIVRLALIFFLSVRMDLKVSAQSDSAYGKVYFMRLPREDQEAVLQVILNYCNIFIDSNFICKLDERKYFIASVPAGMHRFEMQARGKKIKAESKSITFNVEAGKSYFIQLVFRRYSGRMEPFCKYLTEERANMMLPDLKEDKSCNNDAKKK